VDDEQLRGALEGAAPRQRGEHQHAERPDVRGLRAGLPVSVRARAGGAPPARPLLCTRTGNMRREKTRHARAPGARRQSAAARRCRAPRTRAGRGSGLVV